MTSSSSHDDIAQQPVLEQPSLAICNSSNNNVNSQLNTLSPDSSMWRYAGYSASVTRTLRTLRTALLRSGRNLKVVSKVGTKVGAKVLPKLGRLQRLQQRFGRLMPVRKALEYGRTLIGHPHSVGEHAPPTAMARMLTVDNAIRASYAVSWGYVLYDVYRVTQEDYEAGARGEPLYRATSARLIYNSAASMLVPHVLLHYVSEMSERVFCNTRFNRWGPLCVALASVPVMPRVVDPVVAIAVERTYETLWPCDGAVMLRLEALGEEVGEKED
eukprot:PhM_4_TR10288/c0_g1_i1/m.28992/K17981/MTFP1, MTP18; mitochondrial fission process protein 1